MKKLRKFHKWPSLIVGLFILLFCVSGIVMNHRSIFGSLNFPRFLMPGDYHYKNWNLASIKGFLPLKDSSLLVYGNVGIWKTDKLFKEFSDFNNGFPKGIDHRKTFSIVQTANNRLFAGTLFGLYEFNYKSAEWQKLELPENSPRIVKLLEKDSDLIILTRSKMYNMPLSGEPVIHHNTIPAPAGHDGKVGMFRTLWVVHSGEIFGLAGKLIVDLVGLSVIFMTLTGFFYTFLPKFSKKLSASFKKKLQKANKKTINWHTLIGVYGIPILLITVITGMFLRPPLLIPIANKHITAIPGTILAHENIWHDKLRDAVYDTTLNAFIISTSEGFIHYSANNGQKNTKWFSSQPPVSVMGINAFERLNKDEYIIASFSGIFRWNIQSGVSTDMITGLPVQEKARGNPFGAIAVAGVYMQDNDLKAILDYGSGWINFKSHKQTVPEMPVKISKQPISWWNLALEVHTGRIFAFLLGDFYILYVPLMGILVLVIIITGFLMYWKSSKRKKKKITSSNKTEMEILRK